MTIPPKCNAVITPQLVKQLEKTPIHIDKDLADLGWLPQALYPDTKQDKRINTPILSCTPTQDWITIDQLGSPETLIMTFKQFELYGGHPPRENLIFLEL